MTTFLVGAWFVLGILGVALDFANPAEDDGQNMGLRSLWALFGPFFFFIVIMFIIFNPAPVRPKENL